MTSETRLVTLYQETGEHDWCREDLNLHGSQCTVALEEVTIDYEAAIAKHNELYPVPLSARGEEWTRQIVDAALHTEREPASTVLTT